MHAARNAQGLAERAFAGVESAVRANEKQIPLLQNSLTNLKLRKETSAAAQTECVVQHDKCKQKNDELQLLSNDDEPAVNTAYGEVEKYYKGTCREERQVRDTCQYMAAARKLLSETAAVPEDTASADAGAKNAGSPTA